MARFFLPVGRQNDKMIVDFRFGTPFCYLFFSTEPQTHVKLRKFYSSTWQKVCL